MNQDEYFCTVIRMLDTLTETTSKLCTDAQSVSCWKAVDIENAARDIRDAFILANRAYNTLQGLRTR